MRHMERNISSEILHQILNMGEMLLNSGAEIKRVEQTMNRLGEGVRSGKDGCVCHYIKYCRDYDISGRD